MIHHATYDPSETGSTKYFLRYYDFSFVFETSYSTGNSIISTITDACCTHNTTPKQGNVTDLNNGVSCSFLDINIKRITFCQF